MSVKVEKSVFKMISFEPDYAEVAPKLNEIVVKGIGKLEEDGEYLSLKKWQKLTYNYGKGIQEVYKEALGETAFEIEGKVCILKEDVIDLKRTLAEHQIALRERRKETLIGYVEKKINAVRALGDLVIGYENDHQESQVPEIREKLFKYIEEAKNPLVEKEALLTLLELVENDPVTKLTWTRLIQLLEKVLEKVKNAHLQNENNDNKELLIHLFGVTLETILLHMFSPVKSGGKLSKESNRNFWNVARELQGLFDLEVGEEDEDHKGDLEAEKKLYKVDDSMELDEVRFWIDFSVEAVKWVETDKGLSDTLGRVWNVVKATFSVARAIDDPINADTELESAYYNMKEAFAFISFKKNWFEDLLYIRKIARLGLKDFRLFQPLIEKIQEEIDDKTNKRLLFGIVISLEHAALHSPVEAVQEGALKLMLQMSTMDQPFIQKRVFKALVLFAKQPHSKLSNTAELLLMLLGALEKVPEGESLLEIKKHKHLSNLFVLKEGLDLNEKIQADLFRNVFYFFLKRFTEIKGRKGAKVDAKEGLEYAGQGFMSLLSSAEDIEAAKRVVKCLAGLSPVFLAPDIRGYNLYHYCVLNRNYALMGFLQDNDFEIDINAKDFIDENTPLHFAVKVSDRQLVQKLLSHTKTRANPHAENKEGKIPLHLAAEIDACEGENMAIIDHLCIKTERISFIDHQRQTPLNRAIAMGDPAVTEILIENDADVGESIFGQSPIYQACHHAREMGGKHEEVLRAIIEKELKRDQPFCPLDQMAIMGVVTKNGKEIACSPRLAEFIYTKFFKRSSGKFRFDYFKGRMELKKKGEKLYLSVPNEDIVHPLFNKNGRPILQFQATAQQLFQFRTGEVMMDELRECLKNGDGIEGMEEEELRQNFIHAKNHMGITPLHMAVIWGNIQGVEHLVSLGVDINAQDSQGMTPLHFAALFRKRDLIEILLKADANYKLENTYGENPFLLYVGKQPERSIQTHYSFIDPSEEPDVRPIEKEVVDLFLGRCKGLLKSKDKERNNVLHHALIAGETRILEPLCKLDPRLLQKKNKRGQTPLGEIFTREKMETSQPFTTVISKAGLGNLEETVHTLDAFLNHMPGTKLKQKLATASPKKKQSVGKRRVSFFEVSDIDDVSMQARRLDRTLNEQDRTHLLKNFRSSKNLSSKIYSWERILNALFGGDWERNELLKVVKSLDKKLNSRHSFIHMLAELNQVKMLKHLLKLDPSMASTEDGTVRCETPLHRAVMSGSLEVVKAFFKLHAKYPDNPHYDIYRADGFGNNIGHLACVFKQEGILRFLLGKNYRFDIPNDSGGLPVHLACVVGNKVALESPILENYFLVRDGAGEIPLHIATRHNHIDTCINLIMKDKSMLEMRNEDGDTPAHIAAANGRHEILKYYLDRCGVWTEETNSFSETLLHSACAGGSYKTVYILLTRKCNYKATNFERETALHYASFGLQAPIVKILLQQKSHVAGEDVIDMVDMNKETAIQETLKKENLSKEEEKARKEIVKLFVLYGCDLSLGNEMGATFMHNMCLKGAFGLVKMLTEMKTAKQPPIRFDDADKPIKISFNLQDNRGNTPLHYAVMGNHEEIIQHLLNQEFVKKDLENNEGLTPFFLALSLGKLHLVDYFWAEKADLLHKDSRKRNFLHILFEGTKKIEGANIERVQQAMKENPRLLVERDDQGRTPLHVLVEHGHDYWLKIYLKHLPCNLSDKKKNIFHEDNTPGKTPQQIAREKQEEYRNDPLLRKAYQKIYNELSNINPQILGVEGGKLNLKGRRFMMKKIKRPPKLVST